MRASRVHFTFSACIVAAFAITLFLTLGGFFRSVEKNGSTGTGESRIVAQLKGFQEQLKQAEDAEAVKRALKSFDLSSGFGTDSQVGKDLRKSYTPVIAIFANKPREAESRYLLGKKRELMELLVNNYRKEIPRGDIRIRAIYLNILFDTQSSLLNENTETEEVFLRRNKERLTSLHPLVPAADAALAARIASLESLFGAYEKGFTQSADWHSKKMELLERSEKAIPKVAHELYGAQDSGTEDFRRSFLFSCVLAILVACGSVVALLIAHKLARLQFETRSGALVAYLREFGRERSDPQSEKAAELLQEDADWAVIFQKTKAAEEEFVVEYQTHLALTKSLRLPYIVFSKDRVARLWNEEAAKLFCIEPGITPSVDDIIRQDLIQVREGDSAIMTETVRGSFSVPQADTFEFLVRFGDSTVPVELISSPIVSGRAAGGKVYCFREIRNEADRIDRAVHQQMARVREFVQKVSNFYPAELVGNGSDSPAVREMTLDLNNMKGKIDEREHLWKSETSALIDQVVRQKEILQRLTSELASIRHGNGQALDLLRTVHTADGDFFSEVCALERDVQRWRANRAHLLSELAEYEKVVQTTAAYEQELRRATETMSTFLKKFENGQNTLRKFAEEARIRAVNLGLTDDSSQWEYADHARAYAESLQQFLARTSELVSKVSEFMSSHPAGSLAPHLSGSKLDPMLLGAIEEEQDRLAAFFQRWKESGAEMVEGGEQALDLMQTVDKTGAVAAQLSETVILINDQAKGNLSRWN
jgi:hypothetical protein